MCLADAASEEILRPIIAAALALAACGRLRFGPSPEIRSFTAEATQVGWGEPLALRWSVTGADTFTLDGAGPVGSSGAVVRPTRDTDYVLRLAGVGGEVRSAPLHVTVTASLGLAGGPDDAGGTEILVRLRHAVVSAGAAGGTGARWQIFAPEDFAGNALREALAWGIPAPAPSGSSTPPARTSFCIVRGLDFENRVRKAAVRVLETEHAAFYVDAEDLTHYPAGFFDTVAGCSSRARTPPTGWPMVSATLARADSERAPQLPCGNHEPEH